MSRVAPTPIERPRTKEGKPDLRRAENADIRAREQLGTGTQTEEEEGQENRRRPMTGMFGALYELYKDREGMTSEFLATLCEEAGNREDPHDYINEQLHLVQQFTQIIKRS